MTQPVFDTPVLLIAWRRPQLVRQVIYAIKDIRPMQIFVACDGFDQSRPQDFNSIRETRSVIESEITWPCTLHRLYSETNLGCKIAVSRAITWFFDNVSEGIILEDDCLPNLQFFYFCRQLLSLYRDDTRVASIGGFNGIAHSPAHEDVVFSKYFECWGWATWRRAWRFYDDEMRIPRLLQSQLRFHDCFDTAEESNHWSGVAYKLITEDKPCTWDYRFQLCCQAQNMVHAISTVSLVTNIGFGEGATHCVHDSTVTNVAANKSRASDQRHFACSDVIVCPSVIPNKRFDRDYACLHGIVFSTQAVHATLFGQALRKIAKILYSIFLPCIRAFNLAKPS